MIINDNLKSPNYCIRNGSIDYIILHYTEMSMQNALDKLCDPLSEVSAHYFIAESGEVLQLVDDKYAAWHAGISSWHNLTSMNQHSIGIELDNIGTIQYATKQMQSCINLCLELKHKYSIPRNNILGHSDIAPDRKIDPGIFFDWQLLDKFKLGIHYRVKQFANSILHKFGDTDVAIFQDKLRFLGYKIDITGVFDNQTSNVVRSFQSHFNPFLIKQKGIDFYRNNDSKYSWDSNSNSILDHIYTNL